MDNKTIKFSQLIQILLDISLLWTLDGDRKTREAQLKFPKTTPHVAIKDIAKQLTPYALKVIQKEAAVSKISYTTITVKILYLFTEIN